MQIKSQQRPDSQITKAAHARGDGSHVFCGERIAVRLIRRGQAKYDFDANHVCGGRGNISRAHSSVGGAGQIRQIHQPKTGDKVSQVQPS